MKKVLILFVCVVSLTYLSPLVSFSKEYKETIRLTTGPWLPFTGEDLPHYGFASNIVTAVFASENIRTQYIFRPWKRALKEAMEGKFEGSILWRRTPEREHIFYFSEPVIIVEVVFFHLKSVPFEWTSLEDLKKKKVMAGVVRGLEYDNEFDKAVRNGELLSSAVTTQKQNLKKLLLGRIDITPMIRESGYATISKEFSPEEIALFTHHPVPLAKHTLHLILSKKIGKNYELLKLFERGFKRFKDSGDYDQRIEDLRQGK